MIIKRKRLVAILLIFMMMFSAFSTLLASANEVEFSTDEELAVEDNLESEIEDAELIEEEVTNDATEETPKRIIFDEKPDELIDDLELLPELNVEINVEENEALEEDLNEEMMSIMDFSPMAIEFPLNIKLKMVDTTGQRQTTGRVNITGNGINRNRTPDANGILDFGRLHTGVYKVTTVIPPTGLNPLAQEDKLELYVNKNSYYLRINNGDGNIVKAITYDLIYEIDPVSIEFVKKDDLGNVLTEGIAFELVGKRYDYEYTGIALKERFFTGRFYNQYLDSITDSEMSFFSHFPPVGGEHGGTTYHLVRYNAQNQAPKPDATYTIGLCIKNEYGNWDDRNPAVTDGYTSLTPLTYTEHIDSYPIPTGKDDYTFILEEHGASPRNTFDALLPSFMGEVTFKASVDSNGMVKFDNVLPGEYTLKETEYNRLTHIKLPDQKVTVTNDGKLLDSDGREITELINTRKTYTVSLRKRSEDGKNLQGAIFRLAGTGIDGRQVNELSTASSTTGFFRWTGMYPGTYTITEETSPEGYILDNEPKELKVDDSNYSTPTLYLDGEIFSSRIVINKEIPSSAPLKLYKKNVDGDFLEGATFKITGGEVDKTITSDTSGLIDFGDIPFGTYTLTETQGPYGYVSISPKTIRFMLTDEYEAQVLIDDIETDVIVNEREKTTVTLEKEDAETNRKLEGAVFNLKGNGLDKNVTSNTNGQLNLGEIPVGTYTLTETKAPIGYQLDNTPKTMVVTKTTVTIDGRQGKILYNTSLKSAFHINKVDEAGQGLQGATFKLVGLGVDKTATSGTDGKVDFGTIPYGTYTLTETKAPDNYILDSKPKEVVIGDVITIDGERSLDIENKSALRNVAVKKVNTDNQALKGAKFLLEGNGVSIDGVTDEEGIIIFSDLPFGSYTIRETEAPTGYKLLPKPQEITINEETGSTDGRHQSGYDQLITVVNYRSDEALPDTGTLGMLPYLLIGGLLIVGGLFVYKRKDKESKTK